MCLKIPLTTICWNKIHQEAGILMMTNLKKKIVSDMNLATNDFFKMCFKRQDLIQKHTEKCEASTYIWSFSYTDTKS